MLTCTGLPHVCLFRHPIEHCKSFPTGVPRGREATVSGSVLELWQSQIPLTDGWRRSRFGSVRSAEEGGAPQWSADKKFCHNQWCKKPKIRSMMEERGSRSVCWAFVSGIPPPNTNLTLCPTKSLLHMSLCYVLLSMRNCDRWPQLCVSLWN